MNRTVSRVLALLLAAPALALAQAQGGAGDAAPARSPSALTGNATATLGGPPAAPPSSHTASTGLLGGARPVITTPGVGLENAVNSGGPQANMPRNAPRKVCPPGLVNQSNNCVVPMDSVLSQ